MDERVGKGMMRDTRLKDIPGGVQWLQGILERFNRIRSVQSLFLEECSGYKRFLETVIILH
ncbi:hypothetical protein F2Q69_00033716 [Brassica cretica]|uniref:Uncharacterized protein n=1 Tax=Brassica cretica TaxID=69181 RepID=A0A8S9SED4_BRACR|nr:hypothetical protein F2Q69_00033716 [Brassica cretica]